MALINENYLKLPEYYFFNEIEQKINAHNIVHPDADVIRLGLGDVSQPLPKTIVKAMEKAILEMGKDTTFRGYGPYRGYPFLIEKIIKYDYNTRGVTFDEEEIFIGDGAKSDVGNMGHIFGRDNIIAITDPVYPVYENATIIGGRSGYLTNEDIWSNIVYLPCTEENAFIPQLPKEKVDIIYLCYPNNPTGVSLSKKELKKWVDYALENQAIIIYDGAYAAYVSETSVPHSIYEIKGAKKCAIEIRTYSKMAGFTGLRCSYTVIPNELVGYNLMGEPIKANKLWSRRASTYYNGTSYIVQRGAEAIYSKDGLKECKANIEYYLTNTAIMREELTACGFKVFGGISCPHIWVKTPDEIPSWRFFQQLLYELQIVCTPGAGFGKSGEGFFRLTGFNTKENTIRAMKRIKGWK